MKVREFVAESGVTEATPMGHSNQAAAMAHVDEVLRDIQMKLEREVEWTLSDHVDPRQIKQLLGPINQAVANAINWVDQNSGPQESVEEDGGVGGTGAGGIATGGGNGFGLRSPFGAHRAGKNPFKKAIKRT